MNRYPARLRPLGTLLGVCSLISVAGTAGAGGFALIEHGASGLGNAYAGAAAVSTDTSTVWFNPAGMSELPNRELAVGLHILTTDTTFTDRGTSLNFLAGGGPVSGPDTASPGTTTALPNFYYVAPINDQWSYGLSIGVPFGSSTEYDSNWKGRYTTVKSGISVIDINPAVSFQLNDKVRFGAGLSVQQLSAELGSAVDSGAICFTTYGEANPTLCTNQNLTPGNVDTDGYAEITGDSIGVGFNLGVLFVPSEKTKIGLAYRHEVSHELDGDIDFELNPALEALLRNDGIAATDTAFLDTTAKAAIDLPATFSLSAAHFVNDKLELLGDVTWTGWSTFQELLVEYPEGSNPDQTLSLQEWEDVYRISAGVNYQYSDKLMLRGGLAYDQEAIPSPARRTARIPGNDRTWLAFGAGYQFSQNISFDVGYTHLFLDETVIDNDNAEATGGTPVLGLYDAAVDIFSAQFNWQFN